MGLYMDISLKLKLVEPKCFACASERNVGGAAA